MKEKKRVTIGKIKRPILSNKKKGFDDDEEMVKSKKANKSKRTRPNFIK